MGFLYLFQRHARQNQGLRLPVDRRLEVPVLGLGRGQGILRESNLRIG